MSITDTSINTNNLKRDLTLRFTLLLSLFLVLLTTSYIMASKAIIAKEHDSVLLNIAGRQRMLIRQYVSEINQVLIGLASSNLDMVLEKKKEADRTAKLFETIHHAIRYGGKVSDNPEKIFHIHDKADSSRQHEHENPEPQNRHLVAIPAADNIPLIARLEHVEEAWKELKRISRLSLRANTHQIAKNRFVRRLLNQATLTSKEMDRAVKLMADDSREKLEELKSLLFMMLTIGIALFLGLIYFVYNRIVTPLDSSFGLLKEATDRLAVEKAEADKASQAKTNFLSSMSHELRTPLNAIIGFSQLLELDDDLSPDTSDNAREIHKAGTHLLDLINEILDLSRIESGRLELSIEQVGCKELMGECIALVEPIAEKNDISIKTSTCPNDVAVSGDRTRIKQVLVNLLSNAIKYNRKGGQVFIEVTPVEDKFYRISVRDTGMGIRKENLDHVFESFNRMDAENTEIEGTGIGLVITRNLVEMMGGKIGFDSEYGVGTTFWVELPVARMASSDTAHTGPESDVADQAREISYRVLYIEDNPANLKLVEKILSKRDDIRLFSAHTPTLGLELARLHTPELVLLDIQMPGMDGFEVLRELRSERETQDIPVIAVSANAMSSTIKKARAAGFDDYLTKPLDVTRFNEAINNLLKTD